MDTLTTDERNIVLAAIDRYLADIQKACKEDQGVAEGAPGTIGHSTQENLKSAKSKLAH